MHEKQKSLVLVQNYFAQILNGLHFRWLYQVKIMNTLSTGYVQELNYVHALIYAYEYACIMLISVYVCLTGKIKINSFISIHNNGMYVCTYACMCVHVYECICMHVCMHVYIARKFGMYMKF